MDNLNHRSEFMVYRRHDALHPTRAYSSFAGLSDCHRHCSDAIPSCAENEVNAMNSSRIERVGKKLPVRRNCVLVARRRFALLWGKP